MELEIPGIGVGIVEAALRLREWGGESPLPLSHSRISSEAVALSGNTGENLRDAGLSEYPPQNQAAPVLSASLPGQAEGWRTGRQVCSVGNI